MDFWCRGESVLSAAANIASAVDIPSNNFLICVYFRLADWLAILDVTAGKNQSTPWSQSAPVSSPRGEGGALERLFLGLLEMWICTHVCSFNEIYLLIIGNIFPFCLHHFFLMKENLISKMKGDYKKRDIES